MRKDRVKRLRRCQKLLGPGAASERAAGEQQLKRPLEEIEAETAERTRRVRILARIYEETRSRKVEGRIDFQAALRETGDGLLTCSECRRSIDLATDDGKGAEWFGGTEGWACRTCLGKPLMGP